MHAELGAERPRDRTGDLELEARFIRALTGEREIRRIGAHANPPNLTVGTRGRDHEENDREAERFHSLSPNTTTMSL